MHGDVEAAAGVEPPAVLFAFDPVDWPAGSYEPVPLQMFEGPGSEWEQAFRRWKAAAGIGLLSIRIRALVTGWIC